MPNDFNEARYQSALKNVPEIEITPQMVEAGVERLCELLQAGTGSAFVVSEVYQAMKALERIAKDRHLAAVPDTTYREGHRHETQHDLFLDLDATEIGCLMSPQLSPP
jgi:hypothetical protein